MLGALVRDLVSARGSRLFLDLVDREEKTGECLSDPTNTRKWVEQFQERERKVDGREKRATDPLLYETKVHRWKRRGVMRCRVTKVCGTSGAECGLILGVAPD